MGFFATRARQDPTAVGPGAGKEPSGRERHDVPPQFVAVGEALASGTGSAQACEVAGRALALDGTSLDEALAQLAATAAAVTGGEPTFSDVRALSLAWSESTLAYLHQLSCEDPLTGLASLAHLRSRLAELYRSPIPPDRSHGLVVLALPASADKGDSFTRAMHLARLGKLARTVFTGTETIARSGTHRVVVLADRDDRLGRRVGLIRRMTTSKEPTRVWIEGLPPGDEAAAQLLDEICRR